MESNKVKGKRRKLKGFFWLVLGSWFLILGSAERSEAQDFAEWFQQGKTQIKYLVQQIAALNACASGLEQGYRMAKNEWGSISNFKNGEFGLHQTYYSSLSQVNPVVKSSVNMTSVQAEQQSIISQFNALNNVNGLSPSEQSYINAVAAGVIKQSAQDLSDLQTVLTAGQLAMSDDERIQRINKLTAAIKDKYVFTCHFTTGIRLLCVQRSRDNNDAQTLNSLYGINN